MDGTLLDSSYLHVAAWLHTFDAIDRPVQAWRIHRDFGMDSGEERTDLLDDDAGRLGPDAKRYTNGPTPPRLAYSSR